MVSWWCSSIDEEWKDKPWHVSRILSVIGTRLKLKVISVFFIDSRMIDYEGDFERISSSLASIGNRCNMRKKSNKKKEKSFDYTSTWNARKSFRWSTFRCIDRYIWFSDLLKKRKKERKNRRANHTFQRRKLCYRMADLSEDVKAWKYHARVCISGERFWKASVLR